MKGFSRCHCFLLGALTLVYFPRSGGLIVTSLIGMIAAGYLYCQARMLQGAKGIPSWAHPALIPYLMATGLTEGMGLAICFPALASPVVQAAFALLLVMRLVTWLRYTHGLQQGRTPQDSLAVINGISGIFLSAGHFLPIILLVVAALKPGLNAFLVPAAGGLAAVAGWFSKAVIITRAAHTQGFAIPTMPIRGQGVSGQSARQEWQKPPGTKSHA